LTLAAAKINSTIGTSGKQSGMSNLANQITIDKGDYSGTQLGLGYQMSAQTLLGASHTRASGGATLTNMQARYDFSKRTTGYAMYGLADNSTAAAGGILFAPFAPGTSQTTVNITDTSGKGIQGVAGVKQSAIGLGMIHRF